jgi:AcrR family transcriptional regulator
MTSTASAADTASEPRHASGAGPRTARRAQTRERLIAAAVGVFAERGVIGASVEEISESAGFTRGAFYSNFADKDDLVLAMLQHYTERDFEIVQEITARLTDDAALRRQPPGVLINMALARLFGDAKSERNAVLARHEMDLYAARRPPLRQPYRQYCDQLQERVAALIDGTLETIGLQFTIDSRTAIELLHASASRAQMNALLRDAAPESGSMEVLLTAITRPVDGPDANRVAPTQCRD